MDTDQIILQAIGLTLALLGVSAAVCRYMFPETTSGATIRAARLKTAAVSLLMASSAVYVAAEQWGFACVFFVLAMGDLGTSGALRTKAKELRRQEHERAKARLERDNAAADELAAEFGLSKTPRVETEQDHR